MIIVTATTVTRTIIKIRVAVKQGGSHVRSSSRSGQGRPPFASGILTSLVLTLTPRLPHTDDEHRPHLDHLPTVQSTGKSGGQTGPEHVSTMVRGAHGAPRLDASTIGLRTDVCVPVQPHEVCETSPAATSGVHSPIVHGPTLQSTGALSEIGHGRGVHGVFNSPGQGSPSLLGYVMMLGVLILDPVGPPHCSELHGPSVHCPVTQSTSGAAGGYSDAMVLCIMRGDLISLLGGTARR